MIKFLIAGLFALSLSSVAFAQVDEVDPVEPVVVCEATTEVLLLDWVGTGVVEDYAPGKSGKSGKAPKWTMEEGTGTFVVMTTEYDVVFDEELQEDVCVALEPTEGVPYDAPLTQYVNPGGQVVYKF